VAKQATGTVAGSAGGAAGTGAVAGTGTASAVPYTTGHFEHNPGRPMSWVGTSIVIVGFLLGGASFIPNMHWVLFWVGVGIAVLGCLVLAFTKTFNEDWY
jgi:hypothetical protein